MMASTKSCFSFVGLVSSKRRWQMPPNSCARPKFRQMDFACPKCRYPFGSGGNRVTTLLCLPEARSASMICLMKFEAEGGCG